MNTQTIYLQPTKFRKKVEMINHLLPGIILVINGFSSLYNPEEIHLFSPYLNIASGTAVILAGMYELRFAKHENHTVVSWIDIFAGIMLITEALNHYHSGKIFQPAFLYLLLGIFTILKGVYHTKFPKIRRITFTDEGFMARTSKFHKLRLTWKEITSIRVDATSIQMVTTNGRNRIFNMKRIENTNDIIAMFRTYASDKILT